MELYLDCGHGISGHMALAALSHLGVDFAPLEEALAHAGVRCRLDILPESRAAGSGRRVVVSCEAAMRPLRRPVDMAAIFRAVDMAESTRACALTALKALTAAEAEAHEISSEDVHFHQVGAIDILVDILGVCWGLEQLGARRIMVSPLPWFSGSAPSARGPIPLPAPTTAFLLRGKPVFPTDAREELITPTGAALVHALADGFADGPCGLPVALGTGYDSRPTLAGLRIWLVEPAPASGERADHARGGREHVLQLETHLDHLSGEELGMALTALASLPETLDVLWLPGIGKKNRPSGLLRLLCLPEDEEAAARAVLRHTHSLGLRRQCLERLVLPREPAACRVAGESLAAKAYVLEGRRYVRAEAEAVKEAAVRRGVGAPALRFGE